MVPTRTKAEFWLSRSKQLFKSPLAEVLQTTVQPADQDSGCAEETGPFMSEYHVLLYACYNDSVRLCATSLLLCGVHLTVLK